MNFPGQFVQPYSFSPVTSGAFGSEEMYQCQNFPRMTDPKIPDVSDVPLPTEIPIVNNALSNDGNESSSHCVQDSVPAKIHRMQAVDVSEDETLTSLSVHGTF